MFVCSLRIQVPVILLDFVTNKIHCTQPIYIILIDRVLISMASPSMAFVKYYDIVNERL